MVTDISSLTAQTGKTDSRKNHAIPCRGADVFSPSAQMPDGIKTVENIQFAPKKSGLPQVQTAG